jgi:hypothetical protein
LQSGNRNNPNRFSVPEDEIFPVEEFREFRVRLINDGGDKKSDVKY